MSKYDNLSAGDVSAVQHDSSGEKKDFTEDELNVQREL